MSGTDVAYGATRSYCSGGTQQGRLRRLFRCPMRPLVLTRSYLLCRNCNAGVGYAVLAHTVPDTAHRAQRPMRSLFLAVRSQCLFPARDWRVYFGRGADGGRGG
eukprot:1782153-Rhodomonas_salina.2